jgi:CheY-like chemotaxis protein/HPt (histidine-containing phosphotransfer) domain-containing protein
MVETSDDADRPSARWARLNARHEVNAMPVDHSGADTSAESLANEHLQILLADDSEDIRAAVCAYVQAFPRWEIDLAVNGLQAIAMWRQRPYNLVFMDMQMPLMDGYEATERIRCLEQEDERRRVSIIALTADDRAADVDRSLRAGCTAHLPKPVGKRALLAAIVRYATAGVALPNDSAADARDAVAAAKPGPEVVYLDPDVADLIPRFLDNRRRDLITLREAAGAGDMDSVSRMGHMLKGVGGGYGFDRIAELGGRLELAAATGQTAVHATIAELADHIASVRILFGR